MVARQKRAGQAGGFAVAAKHSADELSTMRREGDRKRWERAALAACTTDAERRALERDPIELERRADIHKRKYFVDLAHRREEVKQEKLLAKNARAWDCPFCAKRAGRVIGPETRNSVCMRHWAEKILKDSEYPPLRTLWTICAVADGTIEEQRETIRALHQQLAEAS